MNEPTRSCQICGSAEGDALVPVAMLRGAVRQQLSRSIPNWSDQGFVCRKDLSEARAEIVRQMLEDEKGELSQLERDVVASLAEHETISRDVDSQFDEDLTFWNRLSDNLATFGGSWTFLTIFAVFIAIWIAINVFFLIYRFDPFPFILLNLLLSCLAAIQAPIIMMSQNRQEAKDRLRAIHDYRVNLKAELEIRQLHEKIDHLLMHQWQRLVEIQQMQLDLMAELTGRPSANDQ